MTVNYGPWVIMVGQCRFINCEKPITPGQDVDNGRSCPCVGTRTIWEIPIPFQSCYMRDFGFGISQYT